tara:strand:+ start:28 stop:861 length:834 start_codon:yes stop_codon:yes gene_type:complete
MIFFNFLGEFLIFFFKKFKFNIEVSFSGGLGNQIISLLALEYLKKRGLRTSVNLDFFNKSLRNLLISKNVTIREWELEEYIGIKQNALLGTNKKQNSIKNYKLNDGILKIFFALEGSKDKNILSSINISKNDQDILNENKLLKPYICVHLRRGDYLNVATYVLPTNTSLSITKMFSSLCKIVVITSDSEILSKDINFLYSSGFEKVIVISSGSAIKTHTIMRNSEILITSNSQFSYSAALFSNGITFIPKKWFGGIRNIILEKLLLSRSSGFSLLKK